MCGIAGIVQTRDADLEQALQDLSGALVHRGPDDLGYLQWDGGSRLHLARTTTRQKTLVGFAHRRLKIIDLSDTGWQPMTSADARYHLIFNGEIYNYVELRRELSGLGHVFRGTSDTEVLLAAFAEWGTKLFPRLVGMFAFAVLDTTRRRVTIARDPFGIKPLFMSRTASSFAFASELNALLQISPHIPKAHPSAVYDYLRYGWTDHRSETLVLGVERVDPGHFLTIDVDTLDTLEQTQYWTWQPTVETRSFNDVSLEIRRHFLENIDLHLRSDVAVGAALSGGIDSSAVVSGMRQVGGSALDINTFTYVGEGADNEQHWAEMVVDHVGANSHTVRLAAEDLAVRYDALILTQGEPFGGLGIAAQQAIFASAAQEGVKVVLDGQGADELLGGYGNFVAARASGLLAKGRLLKAVRLARAASQQAGKEGLATTLGRSLTPLLPGHMSRRISHSRTGGAIAPWMSKEWFFDRGVFGHYPTSGEDRRSLHGSLMDTLTNVGLPALLRYEDRNSMAFSIESRVPFLTTSFAELLLGLPDEWVISDRAITKFAFRKAMRGVVPDAVLDRQDKLGYTTPTSMLLRDQRPWTTPIVSRMADGRAHPVNLGYVQDLIDGMSSRNGDGSSELWRSLNLARWAELLNVDLQDT